MSCAVYTSSEWLLKEHIILLAIILELFADKLPVVVMISQVDTLIARILSVLASLEQTN